MKNSKKTPLGKSIIKSMAKKNTYVPHDDMAIFLQKTETNEEYQKAQKLRSIIEQNSLSEFLSQAEMSNKNFQADRNLKMKDIREELVSRKIKPQELVQEEKLYQIEKNKVLMKLRIPRRPQWNTTDTKQDVIRKQNEAFLEWRRKLAEVEEKEISIRMTPFEKNIEVWKQLWRVVERANILVQIVDARDPLFYRCEDLELYVNEASADKKNLLILNKSDLVSEEIRKIWSEYLNEKGVTHLFFSAKIEQAAIEKLIINSEKESGNILDQLKQQEKKEAPKGRRVKEEVKPKVQQAEEEDNSMIIRKTNPFAYVGDSEDSEEEEVVNKETEKPVVKKQNTEQKEQPKGQQQPQVQEIVSVQSEEKLESSIPQTSEVPEEIVDEKGTVSEVEQLSYKSKINTHVICNSRDVIECIQELGASFRQKYIATKKSTDKPFELEVGMVGYPNVGKSSVINSLLQKKKVAVASMPGKTKHYQTLYLTRDTLLCDCPGLVFPNVASTTAEMILNGVIPIDSLREVKTPTELFVARIPRQVIENIYHLKFKDDIYTAETLLQAYATLKGFFTGRGLPNESYAARIILKDYTNGHIIYCKLPPTCKDNNIWQSNKFEKNQLTVKMIRADEENQPTIKQKQLAREEENLDEKFFDSETAVNEDEKIKALSTEEILDLMEGKCVQGIKLKKQVRKEIKFGLKRGEDLETIKRNYLLPKRVVNFTHKSYVKVDGVKPI